MVHLCICKYCAGCYANLLTRAGAGGNDLCFDATLVLKQVNRGRDVFGRCAIAKTAPQFTTGDPRTVRVLQNAKDASPESSLFC